METTLFVLRGEFGCNRIIDRFIEQDLKFESFGNLGLNFTLSLTIYQPSNLSKILHKVWEGGGWWWC